MSKLEIHLNASLVRKILMTNHIQNQVFFKWIIVIVRIIVCKINVATLKVIEHFFVFVVSKRIQALLLVIS